MATEDPARAIDELTADESPHPLVKHLASDTRDTLVTLAQDNLTASNIDAERNAALVAKTREATADEAERTYIDEALAGTPDLATRVANDGALTPESRNRLFLTLRRTAEPDPPAEVSQATTGSLLDRIGRDGDNSEKITSRTPVLNAYNDGQLSSRDYRFVVKQLDDSANVDRGPVARKDRPRTLLGSQNFYPPATRNLSYTDGSDLVLKVAGGNREEFEPRDVLDPVGQARELIYNSLRSELETIQPKNRILTTPSLRNPGNYPTRDELGELYVARGIAEVTQPLFGRARQILELIDARAQNHRTVVVLRTTNGTFVSGSGETGLEFIQRSNLTANETPVPTPDDPVDAEIAALNFATGRPQYIAASRRFCPSCELAITKAGGVITSPTTAYFPYNVQPFTRLR